jgi:hypothetical protein
MDRLDVPIMRGGVVRKVWMLCATERANWGATPASKPVPMDTRATGVMAQEVQEIVPAAVSHGSDGYLRVEYGKLGLRLATWNEWLREHPQQVSRAN